MKEDRPVLGALLWVLVGAIVAALLFLAYRLAFHEEADQLDNHPAYEVQH